MHEMSSRTTLNTPAPAVQPPLEVERVFVVREDDVAAHIAGLSPTKITQWYLSFSDELNLECRVRQKETEGVASALEIQWKGSAGLSRTETDPLPVSSEFAAQFNLDAHPKIEKYRYKVKGPIGETIELDFFIHPAIDRIHAEVEFTSTEDAQRYQPPAWFGQEITNS
ncbi:MAG: hypothetical protein KDD62_09660, partial [Bdellovibrionales bacterium]|nr:hypothetical protein [Bdellovibrionales bacterium]